MTRTIKTMLVAGALTASLVAAPIAGGHGNKHQDKGKSAPTAIATVASFDGTTLVIKANNGAETSGAVTAATRVKCTSVASTTIARRGKKARAAHHGKGQSRHWRGHKRVSCPDNALAAGAKVKSADLVVTADGPRWASVKLILS